MAMLDGREQVFALERLPLGEFDPSVEGFYRNVQTFPFKVKKRRVIRISIKSDIPVDVAVADEKGSTAGYKQAVKEGTIGPVPTEDNKEMGIVLGVYPGDKATVSVEIWMAKA